MTKSTMKHYLTLSGFLIDPIYTKHRIVKIDNQDLLEPFTKNITSKSFDLPKDDRFWMPDVELLYQTTVQKESVCVDHLLDLYMLFDRITGGSFPMFVLTQLQHRTGNDLGIRHLFTDTIRAVCDPDRGYLDFERFYRFFTPTDTRPIPVDSATLKKRQMRVDYPMIENMDNVTIFERLMNMRDLMGISRGYMNTLHMIRIIAGNWY